MEPLTDEEVEAPDDDEIIKCWCGAEGTYDQLFDDDFADQTCGGLGELYCYCGGDLCVCHNHGATDCPGCADCEPDDDDDDDYDDFDY